MNIEKLTTRAGAAEALLKTLANRHRLMILCQLLDQELSVSALQERVGLTQSALSQHLARLREDGLVATRREAQTINYRLESESVRRIISLLYELYCSETCAEPTTKRKGLKS